MTWSEVVATASYHQESVLRWDSLGRFRSANSETRHLVEKRRSEKIVREEGELSRPALFQSGRLLRVGREPKLLGALTGLRLN